MSHCGARNFLTLPCKNFDRGHSVAFASSATGSARQRPHFDTSPSMLNSVWSITQYLIFTEREPRYVLTGCPDFVDLDSLPQNGSFVKSFPRTGEGSNGSENIFVLDLFSEIFFVDLFDFRNFSFFIKNIFVFLYDYFPFCYTFDEKSKENDVS